MQAVQRLAPGHPPQRCLSGLLLAGATVTGGLAFALAAQHPLGPVLVLSGVFCWVVLTACFPMAWMFAVPAGLPWLNFAPWTGWRVVEEFDLLLLASLAGAYGRWAWDARVQGRPKHQFGIETRNQSPAIGGPRLPLYVMGALLLTTGVSAWRGLTGWQGSGDTGATAWIFQDEHSPLSSLRLAKSLWFAVLLLPLWLRQVQHDGGTSRVYRFFAWGMCAGLAVVACMALWERAAFPGWLNFSTHYRTTATFWEMHFGGAAIDIYLVASAPFAVWFLLEQKRPLPWLAAATLVALALYAVLTTFSRGVYGAVLVPLLLLGIARWATRHRQWWKLLFQSLEQVKWRGRAGLALTLLLLSELLTVTWGGTYMRERFADSETDLLQRLKHWQRGLALMQTPADHLLGIGLGRLPVRYAAQTPVQDALTPNEMPTEFSGRAQVLTEPEPSGQPGKAFLRLSGPATQAQLGGLFSVNQRLGSLQLQLPHRAGTSRPPGLSPESAPGQARFFGVVLQVRTTGVEHTSTPQQKTGPITLLIKLCEKHLIYEGNCHLQAVKVSPSVQSGAMAGPRAWQTVRVVLRPYQNLPVQGILRRSSSLSLSVVDAGETIDIGSIQLWAPDGQLPLQNANFAAGLAHWLPGAGGYYLPWHIDNLYLELLVERGWLGFGAVLGLWAWAVRCLWRSFRNQTPQTPLAMAQAKEATPSLAAANRHASQAPYLAASILACALAGSVSSVLDAPRIGFLFFSLLFLGVLAADGEKNHRCEQLH